ncbi:hypothetical protein [Bacillus sp. RHFS10]|uniref:hypothetical protein n=1 Tax=Bacillus sp. RHFS10 TaxID=2804501 RepID=UPI001927B678|nr:hypothetical protein [Bacillus sp. RHFS10]MBL3649383.1 hypothetical protein [Bacillus sp. RHFS10]
MGTLVIFKVNEMTVLEDISEETYLDMKKKSADLQEEHPPYMIWHKDLHFDYGY